MKKTYEIRFWAIQAFIGGIVLAIATAVLLYAFSGKIELGANWETLFVGILSALTTLGTVGAVYAQIVQAREHELERELRDNLAARAALNAPLSNLIEYEKRCLKILFAVQLPAPNQAVPKQVFSPPLYPDKDVSYLIDCIKTADGSSAEQLSSIVSKLQIQRSRLAGLQEDLSHSGSSSRNPIVTRHNIDSCIVDALEIYARVERVFPYARRVETAIRGSISAEDLTNSLHLSVGFDEANERENLSVLIAHRYGSS